MTGLIYCRFQNDIFLRLQNYWTKYKKALKNSWSIERIDTAENERIRTQGEDEFNFQWKSLCQIVRLPTHRNHF